MYREKLQSLLDSIVVKDNDAMAEKVVGDLIASTGKYVRAVVELEGAVMSAKHQLEGEEYHNFIGNLDSIRSIAHNSLISNLKIVNRLCDKYEVEPIYSGSKVEKKLPFFPPFIILKPGLKQRNYCIFRQEANPSVKNLTSPLEILKVFRYV